MEVRGNANFHDPMDRILYSPMCTRPPIRWPGGARVALWISPNVEHYEYMPPTNPYHNVFPRVPWPDVQQYAFRDYGNRVGFWRLAQLLDEFGIRATVSLNLGVLDHFPEIREAMLSRNWEFMSHGIYNTRPLFGYDEDEERNFLKDSVDSLRRHTGQDLKGMLGPLVSVTARTFDLMSEAGFTYTADYFHDDQPCPILTQTGRLISVPYTVDLNDGNLGLSGSLSVFPARCKAQFDRLWREGDSSGMVMCIALHPYLIGQPQMIEYLREILDYIAGHDAVWYTTANELTEYYVEHFYDIHVQHARNVADMYGSTGHAS
jgi:allantoinase